MNSALWALRANFAPAGKKPFFREGGKLARSAHSAEFIRANL